LTDDRAFGADDVAANPLRRRKLRKLRFLMTTVYPNIAAELALTGINQLWVADITYIRPEIEFVFLAVALDAYSRRVIGWELDRTLEHDLALAAVQMALRSRAPRRGVVHHSDRGIQYACEGTRICSKSMGCESA
jgi:transposase InsO family protein